MQLTNLVWHMPKYICTTFQVIWFTFVVANTKNSQIPQLFLSRKSVYGPEVPTNSLKSKYATNKSCWAYAKVYLYQFSSHLVHICGHKLKKQSNTTTFLPRKSVFVATNVNQMTCKLVQIYFGICPTRYVSGIFNFEAVCRYFWPQKQIFEVNKL